MNDENYLRELAADIAARGGLNGATMEAAIAAAHDRRQAFAAEIARGETKRAKMVMAALASSIWLEINHNHADTSTAARCCWIAEGGR